MKDRTIIAGALLFSLLGTALLWYSAASIQPEQLRIGEIGRKDIGKAVVIEGSITKAGSSKKGSIFLELSDGTGKIDVPLFPDVAGGIEGGPLAAGARLRVSGTVGEYEGNLQVVPSRAEGVVFLEALSGRADGPETGLTESGGSDYLPISKIDKGRLGGRVCIRGQITDLFYHEAGHIFLDVSDESGTIDVPLFSDLGIKEVQIGAEIRACGSVESYKDGLEVVPESEGDVGISASELPVSEIRDLSEADLGGIVRLKGKALKVSRHSKGHFFVDLDDGTGKLSVALFSKTAEREGIKGIEEGGLLEVTGKVSIYKGTLEIIAFEVELG